MKHFEIWKNRGFIIDISESEWLQINLKSKVEFKFCKIYSLNVRDWELVNKEFDKLQKINKLQWIINFIKFEYLVFVAWRDTLQKRKSRVVIDIREFNVIMKSNIYFMFLQFDIIVFCTNCMYISVINDIKYFHQFLICKQDREKFIFVIHWSQKISNVISFNFKKSFFYAQRQFDAMLKPFKTFAKIYIDDIIIFFHTFEKHFHHFEKIFQLFKNHNVFVLFSKLFFNFSDITFLKQRVSSFGMSIINDKIKTIFALSFPIILKKFDYFLDFTNWLRFNISWYQQRIKFLQKRKTLLNRNLTRNFKQIKESNSVKIINKQAKKALTIKRALKNPTQLKFEFFKNVQSAFKKNTFLIYFSFIKSLFIDVDASKKAGFVVMTYHFKFILNFWTGEKYTDTSSRIDVQSIFFMSKLLNNVEKNYWPMEFKMTVVVWIVKKFRHIIKSAFNIIIIYIDHAVNIFITRQTSFTTSLTNKFNLRLIRVFQYFNTFNIFLKHKAGKNNIVPDAFSHLFRSTLNFFNIKNVFESFYGSFIEIFASNISISSQYTEIFIEIFFNFKQILIDTYQIDFYWFEIFAIAKSEFKNFFKLHFMLKDELFYYRVMSKIDRLCVSKVFLKQIFEQIHDQKHHDEIQWTFNKFINVYIQHVIKHVKIYIKHCSTCNLNKTKRHCSYEELRFFNMSDILFHIISMNFIINMFITNEFDTLLIIIDKFSKWILLISEINIFKTFEWINLVFEQFMSHDWELSISIVFDRDFKFLSFFWRAIWNKLDTDLLTVSAYHQQADGQAKRTNQFVEIALRFHLSTYSKNVHSWHKILSYIQAEMNNVKHVKTDFAPNEFVYEFKIWDSLDFLWDLPSENYFKTR